MLFFTEVIDYRLDDEPTQEKIRIDEMRMNLQMAVEGLKQCQNCKCYYPQDASICLKCQNYYGDCDCADKGSAQSGSS